MVNNAKSLIVLRKKNWEGKQNMDIIIDAILEFFNLIIHITLVPFNLLVDLVVNGELFAFLGSILECVVWVFLIFLCTRLLWPIFRFLKGNKSRGRGIPTNTMRAIISTSLAIWAILCVSSANMTIREVISGIFPMGDYLRIETNFVDSEKKVMLYKFVDVFSNEILLSADYVLPVVAVELLYSLTSFFCKDSEGKNKIISIALEIIAVLSIFVITEFYETPRVLPMILDTIKNSRADLWKIALFGVIYFLILSYSFIDVLSNNIILIIFAFILSRGFVPVELSAGQSILYVVICFLCSILANKYIDREDEDFSYIDGDDVSEIFYSLLTNGALVLFFSVCASSVFLMIIKHYS